MKHIAFVLVSVMILAVSAPSLEAQNSGRDLAGALGIDFDSWQAMTQDAKRNHLQNLSKADRRAVREVLGLRDGRDMSPEARQAHRERLRGLAAAERDEMRQAVWGGDSSMSGLRGEALQAAKGELTPAQLRDVRTQERARRAEERAARREGGVSIRRDIPLPTAGPEAIGTIQYDNNIAMGRQATGNLKGNRFDTAVTTMGALSPVVANGTITQVSAVLSLDTTTFGSYTTTVSPVNLSILGPGATTGMVTQIASATNAAGATQVVNFATPVNYVGPSFIVAFGDEPATTSTFTTTSTSTFTTMSTTTTSMGATSVMTTTSTSTFTTTYTSNLNRFVPATSTGTVAGQGHHGVSISGTDANAAAGINFLVRARGNVVVPVELIGFSIDD